MRSDIFKNHLSAARKQLGLSQRQLARILGFKSPNRVCAMESGSALPTAQQCVAFQLLFKRSFEELWPRLYLEYEATTDLRIRQCIDRLQKQRVWSERKQAKAKKLAIRLSAAVDELSNNS